MEQRSRGKAGVTFKKKKMNKAGGDVCGDIKMAPKNKLTFSSGNMFVLKQDGSRASRSHSLPRGGITAAEGGSRHTAL